MKQDLRDKIIEKLNEVTKLLPTTSVGKDMEKLLEIHGDIHRAAKKLCSMKIND